jgi:ribonuclease D
MSQARDGREKKRRRDPRYDFRARSHESAHANGEAAPASTIPEHPLIPRNTPALIGTPAALEELIQHVRQSGSFAYDSEFIGELSYFPKLCVIQVATHQRVALIDALAGLDLCPFWRLIADETVEKIVHAGQQDLEPAYRQLGRPPANVFDVQVAAGFVGLSYPVGLSKLVRELIGMQLGKAFTFTHWDRRPLTNVQLRYATDDVRYLPALRQAIGPRLEALGHTAWAKEECAALCDPELYRQDPASAYMRVRGANSLPPRNAAVLRELVIWRENAARAHDNPPRSYVRDDVLTEMARNPAAAAASLARVRGLPRPVEEMEGQNIVQAIQRGLALPEEQWPPVAHVEETPGERFSADALWAAVQAWCHGHKIDPSLVTSRQEVARFYRQAANEQDPGDQRLMRGWRGQMLGRVLRDFLGGQTSLGISWRDGTLRAESRLV